MDLQNAPPVGGRVLEWANRWFDRGAPLLAGAAVALVTALATDNAGADGIVLHPAIAVLIGIVSGLPVLIARRKLWPLFVVAALGWIILQLWPAAFIASYYAGSTLRRRFELGLYVAATGVASAIAAVVSFAVGGYRSYMDFLFPNALLALLIYVGLPLVAGLWVSARRQLLVSLRERAERAEREQAARADQARSEERGRIAREMHDVVAHRVSLIVLHAGALEVGAKDPRTAEAADLIRTTGREALADLRAVLGVLRSPEALEDGRAPQPVLDDLERLLEQSRSVGIDVRRKDVGEVRPLPVTVERTAYRVVQEALTNVHKHAGAVRASVVLTYEPDQLEVVIANEPPAANGVAPMPASGFGLVGLAERVHLVGGELSAQPRVDGGFTVRATLPVIAVSAEPSESSEQAVGDPA